ncbi:hypothetical protein C1H46_029930 [Malus baccata]|uniref:Uncharacterized protein n=1 Tax=Malus baccata TaxID=106549 RepID=A0A540LDF0_MALBA|nr:hypothetical protein C1H46_029930 [Malus baccata]
MHARPPFVCDLRNLITRTLKFCRVRVPIHGRIQDLIGRLTLQEKIGPFVNNALVVPRLGIQGFFVAWLALYFFRTTLVVLFNQSFDDRVVTTVDTKMKDVDEFLDFSSEYGFTGRSWHFTSSPFSYAPEAFFSPGRSSPFTATAPTHPNRLAHTPFQKPRTEMTPLSLVSSVARVSLLLGGL